MNIFYEDSDSFLKIWFDKEKSSVTKSLINTNLEHLDVNKIDVCTKSIFLLEEKYFDFICIDDKIQVEDDIDINFIENYIKNKLPSLKSKFWESNKLLFYSFENIVSNWESSDYMLRQSWEIFFKVKFVFIDRSVEYKFLDLFGRKTLNSWNVFVYPKSFYTISCLNSTIKESDINLLYFNDDEIKLIKTTDWSYNKIETLEFWSNSLKKIFDDNWISSLYYQTFDQQEFNDISLDLINQSLMFYVKTVNQWLSQFIEKWEKIVICWWLLNNKLFVEMFKSEYKNQFDAIILPFNRQKTDCWISEKWLLNNVDLLSYINNA